MKEVKIFEGHWTRLDVNSNTNYLFVFGDNDIKQGMGGQAIIRNEPNAFGIPTKKLPSMSSNSFYTDNEYDKNIKKINKAIYKIIKEFMKNKYTTLVLPKDGLGTGLAQLNVKAPKTFKFLDNKIKSLITIFS